MSNYVPARVATEKLGVTLRTLLRWEESGKIKTIRTPNGQRRYDLDSVIGFENRKRSIILYARVSSHSQKSDLERQVQFLVSRYPAGEVVQEIGSGLNFRRKKLLSLLDRILSGDVELVVVCHKDRLARFGFDLIKWVCDRQKVELVVLNQNQLSPEREMVEDILAIIHVFSCRLYGLRKYKTSIRQDLQTVQNDSESRTESPSDEVGRVESQGL
jgi:predicted site-specific integrase-resolvase